MPGRDDATVAAEAVLPRENFPPSPRPPRLLSAAMRRDGRRRRASCPRVDLLILAAVHAGVRVCPGSDRRSIGPASQTPASRRHPAEKRRLSFFLNKPSRNYIIYRLLRNFGFIKTHQPGSVISIPAVTFRSSCGPETLKTSANICSFFLIHR